MNTAHHGIKKATLLHGLRLRWNRASLVRKWFVHLHTAWLTLLLTVIPSFLSAGTTPKALADLETNIKTAIARIRPSLVQINTFAIHWDPRGPGGQGEAMPYQSIGSGIIVDPRGYVLTNAHVVAHARSIQVKLWRAAPAIFTGYVQDKNEQLDLALVRLEGRGRFPAAIFASSDSFRTGDWVIAAGSPYGLGHTVTMGVVSDRARTLVIDGNIYRDLIQTDAAINQGNSGGPLLNLDGEVIGMNTAIYAPDGISTGVGFAIPSSRAVAYLNSTLPNARLARAKTTVEKEPIRMGDPPPHPAYGNCLKCHTFIRGPQNQPTTVALTPPLTRLGELPSANSDIPRALGSKNPPRFARPLTPHEDWRIVQRAAALVFTGAVVFNMLGLGGGFLYVPLLLLFGVGFHTASTTSLFIMTSAHLSAITVFLKSRLIDYKLALVLEPATCLGALFGGLHSDLLGETSSSIIFGGVLLLSSYMIYRDRMRQSAIFKPRSSALCWHRTFGPYFYSVDLLIGLPIAFSVGYLGGMLGFAGGVIKVPMMVLLFGIPIKVAIATSSLMVIITSFTGWIGHAAAGDFDIRLSVSLAIAAFFGARIGAMFTLRAERELLRRFFAVILLAVAVWMIVRVF